MRTLPVLISKEKTQEFLICEEDQEAKLLGWAQAGSRSSVELGKEVNPPRSVVRNPFQKSTCTLTAV